MYSLSDLGGFAHELESSAKGLLTATTEEKTAIRSQVITRLSEYETVLIDFLEKKTEIIKLKAEGDEQLFTFDIDTPQGVRTIPSALLTATTPFSPIARCSSSRPWPIC